MIFPVKLESPMFAVLALETRTGNPEELATDLSTSTSAQQQLQQIQILTTLAAQRERSHFSYAQFSICYDFFGALQTNSQQHAPAVQVVTTKRSSLRPSIYFLHPANRDSRRFTKHVKAPDLSLKRRDSRSQLWSKNIYTFSVWLCHRYLSSIY